jgi:arginyl-tRNA--protein-N-Asp/Glu arginylyltransferase
MEYLHWNEEKITDFSDANITKMYNRGFVFTRIDKGVMHQTRSVRIDLSKFEPSSENRRVLKKVEGMEIEAFDLPYPAYSWELGKLAKDFYEEKFGPGIMSANKIKEMMTGDLNFNFLLKFGNDGYVICYKNPEIFHYSYPFYDLTESPKDMGLGMMTKAIQGVKKKGHKYMYLGSLQRPTDTYKLQFAGLEWFDGKEWSADLKKVKTILEETHEL